jgi:magnesium and cobalt transporter
MDASDGSSNEARSAHHSEPSEDSSSFWGSLFGRTDRNIKQTDPLGDDMVSDIGGEKRQPWQGHWHLRGIRVSEVMTPRVDIKAIDSQATMPELIAVFKETELSRIPVYQGTLDTPLGMAHLKDVALRHVFVDPDREVDLRDIVRPVIFVPPSMSLSVLLTKMQAERVHMEELWTLEKPGQYSIAATAELVELEQEIGLPLHDHPDIDADDVDTIGGLIFLLAGRVPTRGEVISHPLGAEFEIIDADPRRLKRVRLRLSGSQSQS